VNGPRSTDGARPAVAQWGVCLLAALSLAGVASVAYAYGVFFDPIRRAFDLSSGRVSMVFSVHSFVTYAFGALVGYAADRRASHRLLAFGAVCWLAGLLGTAWSDSYLALMLSFGVLVAFGFGVAYIVVYTTVARWFTGRLGLAMSVLSAGFGLGGLVGPPAVEALLARMRWNEAYLVLAVPTTLALVATAVAFRAVGPGERDPTAEPATDGGASLRRTLRSVRFLGVTAGFTLAFYAFYAVLVHFVPYVTSAGVPRGTAALALGLVGGASVPARLAAGHLSDAYGRIPVLLVGTALTAAAVLGLVAVTTPAGALALALVFGLGTGTTGALYSPIVADIFGDGEVGTMLGLTSVAFGVAGVAGPYGTGVALEATGSYALPLLVATAFAVVGGALIALAHSDRFAGRDLRSVV
jgi:MFS family permease